MVWRTEDDMEVRSGEITDFEDLYRFNYRPLCLYALHWLEDVSLAEDVVQESFISLWNRLGAGAEISSRKSYLYISVRNRCLDNIRKSGKYRMDSIDGMGEKVSAEVVSGAEDDDFRQRADVEARLWTAIDSLPEKCRKVFLLNKRDGLRYEEIAEELGLSRNTVRNQISKALKILKEGVVKIYMFLFA